MLCLKLGVVNLDLSDVMTSLNYFKFNKYSPPFLI